MNLRLTDEQAERLRDRACAEGRSMNEVVRTAIDQYIDQREERLRAAIGRIRDEDAELLERLGR
jgi:predicted DNA-binding protein